MPTDGLFRYTFESLARTMDRFTEALILKRFAICVFDYGAPVGLRMALEHPERITAIISQNGNACDEGLSAGWDSMKEYWSHPTATFRESLREAFTPEAIRNQYTQGVPDPSLVSPDGSTLDDFYLARLVRTRSTSAYSQTTVPTSRFIQNFRNISASTSLHFSRSGARTILIFCPLGQMLFDAICPMRTSVFSTPGTSRWKRIVRKSRRPSWIS